MSKPRLLDLFSGAGGAAMGYYRAGFEVVGVDNDPKSLRHYPFPHICADALEYLAKHGNEFDAIHASPPCQYYTRLRHLPWLRHKIYWRSVPPTLEALSLSAKPYVLENVEDCWDMPGSFIICGSSIGLKLYRHRRFLTNFPVMLYPHQKHRHVIVGGSKSLAKRHHGQQGFKEINRQSITGKGDGKGDADRRRVIMGIDWMTSEEIAQAIPPVYTEFIGKALMRELGHA